MCAFSFFEEKGTHTFQYIHMLNNTDLNCPFPLFLNHFKIKISLLLFWLERGYDVRKKALYCISIKYIVWHFFGEFP